MPEQVTHESEHYRQHVRFIIPTVLQLEGESFTLADWSVSGVAMEDFPEELGNKSILTGYLIFDFQIYDFRVAVEIEKVRFNKETKCGRKI